MRHRDKETVLSALKDWKALREKVAAEGGDNYERPVLVKFIETGTFEVMERDIVEDEFYVLRKYKVLRELAPDGKDLPDALREAGKPGKEGPPKRNQPGQKRPGSKPGGKPGSRRGGKRTGRRGRRGGKGGGSPKPE